MSRLAQPLLGVSVGGMFGDFHTTGISFGGDGDGKFLMCFKPRYSIEDQRSVTSSKPHCSAASKATLLSLGSPVRKIRMIPEVMLARFPPMLTEGLFAVAQQPLRHSLGSSCLGILQSLTTRVPPFLSPPAGFVSVARTFLPFFFSVPYLAAEYFLSRAHSWSEMPADSSA